MCLLLTKLFIYSNCKIRENGTISKTPTLTCTHFLLFSKIIMELLSIKLLYYMQIFSFSLSSTLQVLYKSNIDSARQPVIIYVVDNHCEGYTFYDGYL